MILTITDVLPRFGDEATRSLRRWGTQLPFAGLGHTHAKNMFLYDNTWKCKKINLQTKNIIIYIYQMGTSPDNC